MLNRDHFLNQVSTQVERARAIRKQNKPFSDIRDDQGHQYIDLVLEGGGTLGIALLGYVYILEQAGLRFIGIGGTSAGAITAIALAAAGTPSEERVSRLIEPLANMPMEDFIDGKSPGDQDAKTAVQAWLNNASFLHKLWASVQVLDNLIKIDGINRGDAFRDWISNLLKKYNGGRTLTVRDLRSKMNAVPDHLWIDGASLDDLKGLEGKLFERVDGRLRLIFDHEHDQLAVISADLATETKLELPRMAAYLWPNTDDLDVALLARASMSIPGFFAPVRVKSLPADAVRNLWKNCNWPEHCYDGDFLPDYHCLVDGGILSNFPINVFHTTNRIPLRPTFGAKLQFDEYKNNIDSILGIFHHAFNTARRALDRDFIERNPDYKHLVAYIDTGQAHWLDFAMADGTKLDLFTRGADAAVEFLSGFDWEEYKRVRRSMLGV